MNNWLTTLMNIGKKQHLFGEKRNNYGMMWGSLIGLGVGAAIYGLSKNRNMLRPFQNMMNNTPLGAGKKLNTVGLTEFAKELTPDKKDQNNK